MATYQQEKREFWRRHVQQWQASGQSQVTYCGQHNLHPKSLSRWRTRPAAYSGGSCTAIPGLCTAVSGEDGKRPAGSPGQTQLEGAGYAF